jgi:hypothetical protein
LITYEDKVISSAPVHAHPQETTKVRKLYLMNSLKEKAITTIETAGK